MKFLSLDELPTRLDEKAALTTMSAFFDTFSREHVRVMVRNGLMADYGGIFAVEGEEVLGQTFVFRIPYRFPDHAEKIGGIALVGTRPDRAHRGIARRVLQEVHARERGAGVEHVALWTNPSWGAHRLYEELGYRDVSVPHLALRSSRPARRAPAGLTVRAGRPSDVAAIEALHARETRDRTGFVPRGPRLRVQVDLGMVSPASSFLVATRGRRLEGYATYTLGGSHVRCSELLGSTPAAQEALLRALESRKGKRFTLLTLSVASDRQRELRARGYQYLRDYWFVLMGASLRATRTEAEARAEWGTDDPEWVCFQGDRF